MIDVALVHTPRRDLETGKIIDTVSVQRAAAMIRPWVDNMEPFILVGPEGCGKSMLISHMVGAWQDSAVRTQLSQAWSLYLCSCVCASLALCTNRPLP
jgi:dynein heavy chain 2